MGRPRRDDDIDLMCKAWAVQRRKINGRILPTMIEPRERLGKLRCTLGSVREDREGAGQGAVSQNFPEVYEGLSLIVHRGYLSMRGEWRMVMHEHYVEREDPVKKKAKRIGCTIDVYWDRLRMLKAYLSGYISCQDHSEIAGENSNLKKPTISKQLAKEYSA